MTFPLIRGKLFGWQFSISAIRWFIISDICKMLWFTFPFIFFIGLAIGSFINAFEYRLHAGKDFVSERSECVHCHHKLAWYDLFPLISWLLLCGKCRHCKKKISIQYPVVELITGLSFLSFALSSSNPSTSSGQAWSRMTEILNSYPTAQFPFLIFHFAFGLLVISALVFFTVYDLKYGLIPDKVLLPLIIFTVLVNLPFLVEKPLNNILASLGAGLLFFLIIWLTKGRGMGGGDMKLVVWYGLVFGWPNILWIVYLSFVIGGILGVLLLVSKIRKIGQTIPFGPFLTISAFVVLVYSEEISQLFSRYIFPVGF